jgi:hypothetical protein
MNCKRKIKRLESNLDRHKEFLQLVSSKNVPRIRQLCASALEHEYGIKTIIEQIHQASEGRLKPKSYDVRTLNFNLYP